MSVRISSDGRPPSREDAALAPTAAEVARPPAEVRDLLVPPALLADLRAALAAEPGLNARHLTYCTGYEWALRAMVRLGQRLRDQLGQRDFDLSQMDAKVVLEAWWAPLAAGGWGAGRFFPAGPGLVVAELDGSAALGGEPGPAGEPACDLYAGLVAGALSFSTRAERHAVEVQCAALGHGRCCFVAGHRALIAPCENWRREKLADDEIRRRVATLTHAAA